LPPPLIDFDLAEPTTRVYDIANAVYWRVPLCDPLDRSLGRHRQRHHLGQLHLGYGY